MNLRTRVRTTFAATLAAGLAAGLVLAGSTAAVAQRAAYDDPADVGGASLNDIRRVVVDHDAQRLLVRVRVADLRRHSDQGPAAMTIRIDTRAGRPGPELRLTTGLYEGTDYQLMRVRDGRSVGEPLTCPHRVHLGYGSDAVRIRVGRGCLGASTKARVSVKMLDLYDGSHPVTDWLGEPGSWTSWLSTS